MPRRRIMAQVKELIVVALRESAARNTGHLPAFVSASFAFVGAALTMVHIVLATFGTTSLTYISADTTYLLGGLRTAAHKGSCGPADFGTVFVEPNALGHHLHILLLETGVAAMLALLSTTDTGVDARLKFLMRH